MKPYKIVLFLLFCIFFFHANQPTFSQNREFPATVGKQLYATAATIYHSGKGEFDSYLAKNLPFEPVQSYLQHLQKALGLKLINRGEAHITVITPPEYYLTLQHFLTIEEIQGIADSLQMQNMKFDVICLGRGQLQIEAATESTYYFVVRSPELFRLRRVINERFIQKGGKPGVFNPENYFPHITIGFTKRDLHENDGIKKGDKTCVQAVTVQ